MLTYMRGERPNPDELLKSMEQEEEKKQRGKLKIYFGYAAGVGKTYAMLKAALDGKKSGIDIVLGYIEPHARPDTMKLIDGFETIPVKEIQYHNIKLKEMDIDCILERKPQLVLIDEYAHTNAYGSRHQKRYQDVEEILNAGINVYTTVNVQHIESLCDIVASITGIVVKERIPDQAFDLADEVQLVDVEPVELIQRLEEGKIYHQNQAEKALKHFFTEEKLTALREIALRRTADRVNQITERAKKKSGNEYYTEEKILVGLSASPSNPKIIRTASRMAQAFGGTLIGLYVETSYADNTTSEDKKRLKDNIHLAEQMGAKIETIYGDDIPFLMAEYARISGISKIVAGRTNSKRGMLQKASFTDRLIMFAPSIDIYIIPDSDLKQIKHKLDMKYPKRPSIREMLQVLGSICIATIIGFIFYHLGFSETNIITVYILSVMLSSMFVANLLLSFGQSLCSVFIFNYCFTEPRFSLTIYDTGYANTFFITFFAAFLSASLALRMKKQEKELARAAYRTRVMLDMNQLIQKEKNMKEIGRVMATQLSAILKRTIVFYEGEKQSLGEPIVYEQYGVVENKMELITKSERAVAEWVFKNNKRAGATTGTLSSSACYYLAIRTLKEVYGVVAIEIKSEETLGTFENNVIFAILSEAATAMEKNRLLENKEMQ